MEDAMRVFISLYLLWKSATRQKLTWFDQRLAFLLSTQKTPDGYFMLDLNAPDWQKMIANMEREEPLPEAFVDWRWGIEGSIRGWLRRLWRKP